VTSLMRTMGLWADGQNWLDAQPAARQAAVRAAVEAALSRLRRFTSLAELAADYHAETAWFDHVAAEFAVPGSDRAPARNTAYWHRLMEIRHPQMRQRARGGHRTA